MNLLVFGSCVTRDTVPLLETQGLHLELYVARQSVTSIGHPVSDERFTSQHLTSRFQDQMYRGDLLGDALERITRAARRAQGPCALVWDLTDERGGVLVDADEAVLTRTADIAGAGFLNDVPSTWTLHNFGSLQHWLMFKDAAEDLAEELRRLDLWEHTVVLDNRWAEVDVDGTPTPPSLGLGASAANEALGNYVDLLTSLGWTVVAPDAEPVADTHHQWGLTPFHYTHGFYEAAARAITGALERQQV